MKTVKELKVRRQQIESTDLDLLSDRETRKLEKENTKIVFCIQYLETNPREEFIKEEITRLETELRLHEKHWSAWWGTNRNRFEDIDKANASYKNETKQALTKTRIKFLKFIIRL